jgi:phthiodiolone/phenolphthiodiolone dimycocerosates ketoreductase
MCTDVLRRAPAVLAQLGLTVDHYAKGRLSITFAAGERKQFAPYGLQRERPFAHLEEAIKVIKLLWDNNGPVDYDGPIWKLRNAILGLPAYAGKPPKLFVAGGPAKALSFAASMGDGWVTFFPAVYTPDEYAEQIQLLRRAAEKAGRDPNEVSAVLAITAVIASSEGEVEEMCNNVALRWDAAAMLTHTEPWRRAGFQNPLGDDWSYSRDLIPMDWSREDALNIANQVPPEAVRAMRVCGTPDSVAKQIEPWLETGMTHLLIVNYAPLVAAGSFGDALSGTTCLTETIEKLRKIAP